MQEVKLSAQKLTRELVIVEGYQSYWACSQGKTGYSGAPRPTRRHPTCARDAATTLPAGLHIRRVGFLFWASHACIHSFACLPFAPAIYIHSPGCMGNVHWDCVARLLVPAQVLRPGHVTSGQRSVLKLTLFLWTAASARDGMCAAGQPDMSVQSPLYSPQLPPHTTLLAHSCCVFLPAVKAPAGAVTGLCE